MDSRGQARSLEEPLDLRTKALIRDHLPATKENSNSFVTFGIKPHYKVWTSMGKLEFANAA
jgi:hypothetical protein